MLKVRVIFPSYDQPEYNVAALRTDLKGIQVARLGGKRGQIPSFRQNFSRGYRPGSAEMVIRLYSKSTGSTSSVMRMSLGHARSMKSGRRRGVTAMIRRVRRKIWNR